MTLIKQYIIRMKMFDVYSDYQNIHQQLYNINKYSQCILTLRQTILKDITKYDKDKQKQGWAKYGRRAESDPLMLYVWPAQQFFRHSLVICCLKEKVARRGKKVCNTARGGKNLPIPGIETFYRSTISYDRERDTNSRSSSPIRHHRLVQIFPFSDLLRKRYPRSRQILAVKQLQVQKQNRLLTITIWLTF